MKTRSHKKPDAALRRSSPEVSNILFIANKRSGTRSYKKFEAMVRSVCDQAGATYTIEYTKAPRHATELARNGVEGGFDCIVAVGGDGTVNEVALGTLGSSIPMAIVPAGSGNGLARHLGIPLDHEEAIRAIFTSEATSIDTFTLNDRLSLNVSGIGFDGHVAGEFGRDGRRGLMSYARIALDEYQRFNKFQATLTIDDGVPIRLETFIIAVANSAQYGNNARVAPQSSVCDGRLNIIVIDKVPLTRLDMIYSLFRGDITQSGWCEMFECGKVAIRLNRPVRYHIDGEPCPENDTFLVHIRPSSLFVMIPAGRKSRI